MPHDRSNQAKDEPIPTGPAQTGTEETARHPRTGEVEGSPAGPEAPAAPPAAVPAPGVPNNLPGVQAARADAEEGEITQVRDVANAPLGKPDGEVDTRP